MEMGANDHKDELVRDELAGRLGVCFFLPVTPCAFLPALFTLCLAAFLLCGL